MALITTSITEQIYNIIKEKILLQELEVGSKIETREIAKEYDISVMPVRDALKKLCNQGLVENRSRVGFFVRTFSEKEINDIMEMRSIFELYCLDQHLNRINKSKLKSLYQDIQSIDEYDRNKFDRLDNDFHELLINSSNNDLLIKNYNQIKDLIVLFKHMDKERIKLANEEHCRLIESILNGEKEKAIDQLSLHINNVKYSIGKTINQEKAIAK